MAAITRLSLTATPGAVYSFSAKTVVNLAIHNFIARDGYHAIIADDGEYCYTGQITNHNYIGKGVTE